MSGEDKFQETGAKIKQEVEQAKEADREERTAIMNELATIRQNPELEKMYKDSAGIGADNLSGELPLLKIYTANKTLNAELEDGKTPNDGWFFHRATRKQFESINAHVLTISRGFRAEGMANKKGQKGELKFNQVLGGIIVDEGKLLPFIMYFTGLRLQYLWDFGKEAGKYTKGKLGLPIPMFSMLVKMNTESVKGSYGPVWIVKFEIIKNEDGMPAIVTDPGLFSLLRKTAIKAEETIASIIEAKSAEERVERVETTEGELDSEEERVNPDDIPF